jgi:hypothetical protein
MRGHDAASDEAGAPGAGVREPRTPSSPGSACSMARRDGDDLVSSRSSTFRSTSRVWTQAAGTRARSGSPKPSLGSDDGPAPSASHATTGNPSASPTIRARYLLLFVGHPCRGHQGWPVALGGIGDRMALDLGHVAGLPQQR